MPGFFSALTNSRKDVTLEVINKAGLIVDRLSGVPDSRGRFRIEFKYPEGWYRCLLSTESALTRGVWIYYQPDVGLSTVQLNFQFGDVDGDNVVSEKELAFVSSCVGEMSGKHWHERTVQGFAPADFDFDVDGRITAADVDVVRGNLGKVGYVLK